MQEIDKKLKSLVRKYRKLSETPVEPGERKAVSDALALIRDEQNILLDKRINLMDTAVTSSLEDQFA